MPQLSSNLGAMRQNLHDDETIRHVSSMQRVSTGEVIGASVQNNEYSMTTISQACGHGDLSALKKFVALDPDTVNRVDENGYYPLQWACLNNHLDEVNFLLSHGVEVNAVDCTDCTALHWAAVRGNLRVIETLLRSNADHRLKDSSGYTAVHVAAQHGQTAALYLMSMKWSVDIDAPDNEGRTPLHWAAYKGHTDSVRLLLALDARCDAVDSGKLTPLHWAAIKGNSETCNVLLQGGPLCLLSYKDSTGLTPAQLAAEKGHRLLAQQLAEYRSAKEGTGCFGKNGRLAWMNRSKLCPLIWIYILSLLAIFLQKIMNTPPELNRPLSVLAWSVIAVGILGLLFLFTTTTADPGIIRTAYHSDDMRKISEAAAKDEERARILGEEIPVRALDSPALWAGNWKQLCVTCRIVRPLRAKHCSETDRCIEVYDHYCPWVGNVIGKGNIRFFLAFLWLELYAVLASAAICIVQIVRLANEEGELDRFPVRPFIWLVGFAVVDVVVGTAVGALAVSQAYQVLRNLTTNEQINWHRYPYLQEEGQFQNPFDKGCWKNCVEACSPGSTPMAPHFLVSKDVSTERHELARNSWAFNRKGYREVGMADLPHHNT